MCEIRIYRNSEAHFYDHRDAEDLERHYTDDWFRNLRDHGFNGFFLNVWVRRFVAFRGERTPEQAQVSERLRRLTERATHHGVGLYLYLNEPHAFASDDPIWQAHPEMAGEAETYPHPVPTPTRTICTSTPIGREYVYEMALGLYQALPDLKGTVHITASEFPTHCYCHIITNPGGTIFAGDIEHEGIECPRCAQRRPEDVVAEILNLYRRAARDAGSPAEVIAWNWDWVMWSPDPQPQLLRQLDPGISLMASFEAGGRKEIYGAERRIEEYSLISTGPSEQYRLFHSFAQEQQRPMLAKLQLSTTHEAATVANLPLVGHVFEKLKWLRDQGAGGFLGCWNFGNALCLNTAAVGLWQQRPDLVDRDAFLAELCRTYFERDDATGFVDAVDQIEAAFDHYPVANRMLHVGPVSFASSNPFDDGPPRGIPLSQNWLDRSRGDDWDACLGPYSRREVIDGFTALVAALEPGLQRLEQVLFPSGSPWATALAHYRGEAAILRCGDRLSDAERVRRVADVLPVDVIVALPELRDAYGYRCLQEWSNGWFLHAMFTSVRNLFRNHEAKSFAPDAYARIFAELLVSERDAVSRALALCCLDERLGLHLECQAYLVSREKLVAKLAGLTGSASASAHGGHACARPDGASP